jgi:hypothetical protein
VGQHDGHDADYLLGVTRIICAEANVAIIVINIGEDQSTYDIRGMKLKDRINPALQQGSFPLAAARLFRQSSRHG